MRESLCLSIVIVSLCAASTAFAQFGQQQPPADGQPAKQSIQNWQVGVVISAGPTPCRGLKGSIPIPAIWADHREQGVERIEEDVDTYVSSLRYRTLDGLWQMRYTIPQLPPGESAKALLTFRITRNFVPPPSNPETLVIPKNAPPEIRKHLGYSPPRDPRAPRAIDPLHRSVRTKVAEIVEGKQTAWEQVEAIYDWVRDNVKYVNGQFKGSTKTLEAMSGNRDDLTSLFIALCRANRVPARTVWVPDNSYAEFYLQNAEGQGRWIPCQVAGNREFGSISDLRPILQKGDNIDDPDQGPQYFVAEYLTGSGGSPSVKFVRKLLPAN